MLPPIPKLADYGISAENGFLPVELPLARLPDPYYNKWEAVAANLQALILSRRLRAVVDGLPVLSTEGLEHDAEWRRAYCLLCFMAHGYIWGGDRPCDRLPPPVAAPLLAVAARLEVPPVATFAAVCLWNYKPLFVDEGVDEPDNLAALNTLTGSLDESWFYLVSVAFEARGGPVLGLVLAAMEAVRRDDADTVTACLQAFAERLDDLAALLQRMHENCDPSIFYHRIRPFLAGSKNMAEAGLPRGVRYDDGSGSAASQTYRQYSGGSNAQSSLIQFFDIALGVEHRPTMSVGGGGGGKNKGGEGPAPDNFILEMRKYMPGPHARFLHDVAAVANIRPYVLAHPGHRPLAIAYDACLAMLRALRDKHIAIVTRYIVMPSRAAASAAATTVAPTTAPEKPLAYQPSLINLHPKQKPLLNLAQTTSAKQPLKGTGGTALISFLKQARDETGEPAVQEWAQRFLSRPSARSLGTASKMDVEEQPPKKSDVVAAVLVPDGLAGSWTMDEEVGGLCQY